MPGPRQRPAPTKNRNLSLPPGLEYAESHGLPASPELHSNKESV
jgi:hypothetical protein